MGSCCRRQRLYATIEDGYQAHAHCRDAHGIIKGMAIRVLPDQLASQIAAGEVVERPASVVKELVENSLDAGATSITVEVQAGGRKLIQVADNGTGIGVEEVELAFTRHATSKLDSAESLNHITTLGFRGEALAAIAAVSRLTIVTRSAADTAGARLILEGGLLQRRDSVGAPQGVVIAIEDLFYNTPARLKFLKSMLSEKRLIDEFVTRYALAYPQVRFRLSHEGRITFQTAGNGQTAEILAALYGLEVARELLPLAAEDPGAPGYRLQGYIAPPSHHRANRNQITLFVNGRWIRDTQLTYAIIQAYHTLLPVGRYPLAVVFMELPPEEVDVNVHPAKAEVRFHEPNRLFGLVQRAVRQVLLEATPVRLTGPLAQAPAPTWVGALDEQAFEHADADGWDEAQLALDLPRAPVDWPASPPPPRPPAPLQGGRQLPIMRVIGQVGATYIITEGPDGLFLIDQHAAHERILYEQFMAARAADAIPSQGLVTGTALQVTPSQATLLEEQLPLLASLGFQLEPFGPHAFMLRAVPAILARQDPAQAFLTVLEGLENGEEPLVDAIEARLIRRVCKTAAIKGGQVLVSAEMEALIHQLEQCRNPHTCPHGRPTLIHLSVAQLAREFGRI